MSHIMTLKDDIDKCTDSEGMCAVLETHFTPETRQKLVLILSDTKTMLLRSKTKTKDKQAVVPQFLENVEYIIDLVNIVDKISMLVKMDLAYLQKKIDDQNPDLLKEEFDLKILAKDKELSKLKEKLDECEKHQETLATQLHQSQIRMEIAEKTRQRLQEDKKNLEQELWAMKEQLKKPKVKKRRDSKSKDIPKREGAHGGELQDIRTEICLEESEIIKEYVSLTDQKWFNAKELLDNEFHADMEETSKLQVLCDIITIPWENAEKVDSEQYNTTSMCKEEEFCYKILDSHFSGKIESELEAWRLVKTLPTMQDFVQTVTRICLAMVLHKPQMNFKLSDGKYLGDNIHDLYWNSVDPLTERYHAHDVFPALYKGPSLLVKGKVFLVKFSDESCI